MQDVTALDPHVSYTQHKDTCVLEQVDLEHVRTSNVDLRQSARGFTDEQPKPTA